MRIIKFRAWHDDYGMFIPKKLHFHSEDTKFITKGFWAVRPDNGHMTQNVMQFVGTFSGNDVYEGDIVEYDTEDGIAIAEVVFKEIDDDDIFLGGFALRTLRDEREYKDDEDGVGIKVVGNIFENPELLK